MSEKMIYEVRTEADLEGHEINIDKYDYIFFGKMTKHYWSTYPLGKITSKKNIDLFNKHIPQSLTTEDLNGIYWTHAKTEDVFRLIYVNEELNEQNQALKKQIKNLKAVECRIEERDRVIRAQSKLIQELEDEINGVIRVKASDVLTFQVTHEVILPPGSVIVDPILMEDGKQND